MSFKGVLIRFRAYDLGTKNVTFDQNTKSFIIDYPCYSRSICEPYELIFSPGKYKIELWGAQGGNARYQNTNNIREGSGGKGAYVSGEVSFVGTTKLYLYVGGQGEDQTAINRTVSKGGFNGGGNGGVELNDPDNPESGAGGGGATDIRLYNTNDTRGLQSRIVVAGAGGGGCSTNNTHPTLQTAWGASGGKCFGFNSTIYGEGGTQESGIFGKGGDGYGSAEPKDSGAASGGSGSGYYGGTTSHVENEPYEYGGSGGSSYISGYEGCLNINETSNSVHYSTIYFTNSTMKCFEDEDFLDQYGNKEEGHFGNGAAKITILHEEFSLNIFPTCSPSFTNLHFLFSCTTTLVFRSRY